MLSSHSLLYIRNHLWTCNSKNQKNKHLVSTKNMKITNLKIFQLKKETKLSPRTGLMKLTSLQKRKRRINNQQCLNLTYLRIIILISSKLVTQCQMTQILRKKKAIKTKVLSLMKQKLRNTQLKSLINKSLKLSLQPLSPQMMMERGHIKMKMNPTIMRRMNPSNLLRQLEIALKVRLNR